MSEKYPPLTAFLVFYDDGSRDTVCMAAGVTLAEARRYYVGVRFEITEYSFRTAVAVDLVAGANNRARRADDQASANRDTLAALPVGSIFAVRSYASFRAFTSAAKLAENLYQLDGALPMTAEKSGLDGGAHFFEVQ